MENRQGVNNHNYKHGGKGEKLYEVWCSMRRRCSAPSDKRYKNYGGRGVTICQEWAKDYAMFRDWAISAGYQEGLTIDRIDNDGNYEPSNCRWATQKEQMNNQRNTLRYNMDGKIKTLHEIADEHGINADSLYWKVRIKGMEMKGAIDALKEKNRRMKLIQINRPTILKKTEHEIGEKYCFVCRKRVPMKRVDIFVELYGWSYETVCESGHVDGDLGFGRESRYLAAALSGRKEQNG